MRQLVHASTVAIDGKGVLICGASGSGKSSLSLQLLAFGAELVADDQTEIDRQGDTLWASCPASVRGLIEARGIGLLNAPSLPKAKLALCVDLDQTEPDRLPPRRSREIGGVNLPLVLAQHSPHFAAAVFCLVRHGRRE